MHADRITIGLLFRQSAIFSFPPFSWHHRAGVTPTRSRCADIVLKYVLSKTEHLCFVHKRESSLGYYIHRFRPQRSHRALWPERGEILLGNAHFLLQWLRKTHRLSVVGESVGPSPVQSSLTTSPHRQSRRTRGVHYQQEAYFFHTWINLQTTTFSFISFFFL